MNKELISTELREVDLRLRPGELYALSLSARCLGRTRLNLNVYDGLGHRKPKVFSKICQVLGQYLVADKEFEFKRAAALLDADPRLFSINDMKLSIRALWKSDRVGFYKGGNELFRSGWVSLFLLATVNPSAKDMAVPDYPDYEVGLPLNTSMLWEKHRGFLDFNKG